jgi:hypothetical protein
MALSAFRIKRRLLDVVADDIRARGVPLASLDTDSAWQMRQPACQVRMMPNALSFGEHERHFYPTLFRWRLQNGSSHAMVLLPVVVGEGRAVREDTMAALDRLVPAILSTAELWNDREDMLAR